MNSDRMLHVKEGPAPHLRLPERAGSLSLNVLIALVPLCAFSFVYYGMRPVLLVLIGVLTGLACELVGCLLLRRRPTMLAWTGAVTGGIIAAVMSPSAPFWMPAAGAIFGIFIVKLPFGGSGRNVFNPAAGGIAVLTLCFPHHMFTYPKSSMTTPLSLSGALSAGDAGDSLASLLAKSGSVPTVEPLDLFIGKFAGPIGATAVAVLLAVFLFLLATRASTLSITVPYLATCAMLALLVSRSTPGLDSVMYELSAGYLLFGGVFLLNDPVTSPRYGVARVLYGVCAGLLVMAFRYFGRYEEGVCFAVLIMNAFSSAFDRFSWYLVNNLRRAPLLRRLHRP